MTNRNFKLAATALSAVLASLTPSFAQQAAPAEQTAPAQQASTTDTCQASPKGVAPQGKHWYYHTDRSAGRKCWYLGEAGLKTTKQSTAVKEQTPVAQQGIDDARTEAPPEPATKPSTSKPAEAKPAAVERPSVTAAEPEPAADPVPATASTQTMPGTPSSAPLLTDRWPDADAFRPASQTTGQSTPLANSQPEPSKVASPPAPAMKPAAATAATPAPSARPSDQADLTPWRVIFGVAFIVLGLIAVLALVTFRYFWRTDDSARNVPGRLRNIWGEAEDADASPQSYADMIAPSRRNSAARAPQDLDEIEQLLRRAAREPENVISLADPAIRARTQTAPSAARASTAPRARSFRPR